MMMGWAVFGWHDGIDEGWGGLMVIEGMLKAWMLRPCPGMIQGVRGLANVWRFHGRWTLCHHGIGRALCRAHFGDCGGLFAARVLSINHYHFEVIAGGIQSVTINDNNEEREKQKTTWLDLMIDHHSNNQKGPLRRWSSSWYSYYYLNTNSLWQIIMNHKQ